MRRFIHATSRKRSRNDKRFPRRSLFSGRDRLLQRQLQQASAQEPQQTPPADAPADEEQDIERRILSRAVEQSPVSVVITDTQGCIEYVNPQFTKVTGYTAEEAIGQNPRILKSDKQPAAFYRILWQTITSGRDWNGEFCNLKKNGEEYWEKATISPVKDATGKITHFLALKEDITARRQAQLRLRESEERYRQMVEDTDNIVTRVDAAGNYTFLSRAAKRLFGETARVGSLAFENVHPDDRARTMESYSRWITDQPRRIQFENRVLDASGETRYIHWTISFRFGPDGSLRATTSIGHDMTRDHQLRQLREDVDRITRHDLKAPLLGIISVPQLLLEQKNLTEDQRGLIQAMEDAGYHMLRLINLSLDIYKIETGAYRLRPRKVNLRDVLERVITGIARSFPGRKVLVERPDLEPEQLETERTSPYLIYGEELLCHSTLSNLLRNALAATPKGEVTRVTLFPGEPAQVTIHNPLPVPREVRHRFFEKYVSSGKASGTGLGTYSARLLTRVQNGILNMQTSEKEGTTLTITLPRPPEHAR